MLFLCLSILLTSASSTEDGRLTDDDVMDSKVYGCRSLADHAKLALESEGNIAVFESVKTKNGVSGEDTRRILVSATGVDFHVSIEASFPSVGQYRFSSSHDGIPISNSDVIVMVSPATGALLSLSRHNSSISPVSVTVRHGSFTLTKRDASDIAWKHLGMSRPSEVVPMGRKEWYSVDGDIHATWKVSVFYYIINRIFVLYLDTNFPNIFVIFLGACFYFNIRIL